MKSYFQISFEELLSVAGILGKCKNGFSYGIRTKATNTKSI